MRVVVVGLGIQGRKRAAVAAQDLVATVDPIVIDADYQDLMAVPLNSYDAVLLCVPDSSKFTLIKQSLEAGKSVLVEKPLALSRVEREQVEKFRHTCGATVYVAYNHRFEPHIATAAHIFSSEVLGVSYSAYLSYGNGTASLVRQSVWRDKGLGVIPDLASHLLDMVDFWWGLENRDLSIVQMNRFENRACDQATLILSGRPSVIMQVSLVSWRNQFRAQVQCSNGSIDIEGLCKWGPSTLTQRDRKFPSGRPDEQANTIITTDPTWDSEYRYFRELVKKSDPGNLENSARIDDLLASLTLD
jgi:scyllo-inositol 2-dehydrogenase (NADP+)